MKKEISKELLISILCIIMIILYNLNVINLSKLTMLGITLAGILITLDGIFENYMITRILYLCGLISICILPNVKSLHFQEKILEFCDDITLTLMGMCFVFIALHIGKMKNIEIKRANELNTKKLQKQIYDEVKQNLKTQIENERKDDGEFKQ